MSAKWAAMAGSATIVGIALVGAPQKPAAPKAKAPAAPTFERDVAPFIKKYCSSCHNPQTAVAGIVLTKTATTAQAKASADTWNRAAKNIASGHMPPKGTPQPTKTERDRAVAAIRAILSGDCDLANPGRVTLRRLNREEYNNTIRDLTGLDLRPADDFPSDDVGYGFDTIGDVLTISPLLMEKYLDAAERVAQAAVKIPGPSAQRVAGSSLEGPGDDTQTPRLLFTNGTLTGTFELAAGGPVRIRALMYAQQAGPEPAKARFQVDGKDVRQVDVLATSANAGVYEIPFELPAGRHRIGVSFINDFYQPNVGDRNLFVEWIEVAATGVRAMPDSHRRIVGDVPMDKALQPKAAREAIARFALQAYRRPPTATELDRLMQVFAIGEKQSQAYEGGMQLAVQAILSSPNFLYRVETEPKNGTAKERALNGYEYASRLSYFLWSSTPDARLLGLARDGSLLKPEVQAAEVKRMLADPKARALADNFAGQWLQLRKLQTLTPDPTEFPTYSEPLKRAMVEETKRFFLNVLREDRPIGDFLDAKYTFVNEALARHYGIAGVTGPEFRRVSLEGTPRAGLITQASVLTVTSNPTRTSPVKRGKWILENILGTPPPPPPPGVGDLSEDKKITSAASLRQRLEEHRRKPECATCHARMDPLGFSLENFDGVGGWRTKDGAFAIDPSGELPDGTKFAGPNELTMLLRARKGQFRKALAEKLLTYSTGRGMQTADQCFIDEVAAKTEKGGDRFGAMILAVVQSEPFRLRSLLTNAPAKR